MKKLIAWILIGIGVGIIVHHYLTKGIAFDIEDILNHEFFASLCLSLGIGGLIL